MHHKHPVFTVKSLFQLFKTRGVDWLITCQYMNVLHQKWKEIIMKLNVLIVYDNTIHNVTPRKLLEISKLKA